MLKQFSAMCKSYQGIIQKEKVHIDCEKGAQISILANKIETQWWPNNTIKGSKKTIHYINFLFSQYYIHILLLFNQNTEIAFNGTFSFT